MFECESFVGVGRLGWGEPGGEGGGNVGLEGGDEAELGEGRGAGRRDSGDEDEEDRDEEGE